MENIYHSCKWCKFFDNGKCIISIEMFEINSNENLYELTENGILGDAIGEAIKFPKFLKLKRLLESYKISTKRQNEILKCVVSELDDFIPTMVESIDDGVSTVIFNAWNKQEALKVKETDTFYCKYWK